MFWRYNIFWIIWLTLITYLSNKQVSDLPKIKLLSFPNADKLVHFVFYFILVLLCRYGFKKQSAFSFLKNRSSIKIFIFAFFWGSLMEFLQLTVFTYRSAELPDLIANTLGAAFGVSLFLIFDKKLMADSH